MSGLYMKFRQEIIIFIMSMVPVSELRGAIPLGISMGLNPRRVIILSILGNMFIVPLLLLMLDPLMKFLARTRVFSSLVAWLKRRTLRKTKDKIKKYSILGLFLFVAIPIPTTGAWTGCLAASILKLDFKRSLRAIWCGILISAFIVSSFSYHLLLS